MRHNKHLAVPMEIDADNEDPLDELFDSLKKEADQEREDDFKLGKACILDEEGGCESCE